MWEVIGYEKSYIQPKDNGAPYWACELWVAKPYKSGENTESAGKRCKRVWYRMSEIPYEPVLGQTVLIETSVRGKYEFVDDIQAM